MLEKIGLPAKPSLRGNNWVIDATHCQGCSSQFTFINRKHHCRRCGGLFCGSCTQQRMYLRGQGDSPVRVCEPCKTLEEAARFEMRHGHKNRAKRGSSKPAADNEDDLLTKILGDNGNESVSSDKESVHSLPSMQRATSASCSNSEMEIDLESTTPEELRKQAAEEKKKYKVLKAEGKPEEALRAFKRGKELERQAGTLEIELRKNRRKALSSSMTNENTKVGDGKQPKEKDDLVSELRELGWSDLDLHDADKKPVSMTLEGELSTLLKEVSQKTNKAEKGNVGNDRSEVVAIKKKALALKREGKLAEAKEELKRAKILEKQIEEQELLGDAEDSDDEFTSLIRSMDIDKEDVLAAGNDWNRTFDFGHLLRMDDGPNIDGHFEVSEEDMDDPEMSAALQSFGWTEDDDAVDKEALVNEIQSLKREALNKKRAGNTAEALALLKKAKLLEADAGGSHDTPENNGLTHHSAGASSKHDSDHKMAPKSKLAIQRELLALKKKALALRREGRVDEAEQELMKGKALEKQLEELESGPKVKSAALKHVDFSAPMDVDDGEDVTDSDMNDPSYLSLLQNLGWKDEDDGKVQGAAEAEAPKQQTEPSMKSKAEIQRELLALKRKSLALRRQGNVDEAEEVLKATKGLEAQLAEMEAQKQENNAGEKTVVSEVSVAEKPQTGIKEEAVGLKSTVGEVSVDENPRVVANELRSVQQQILAHKRKAVSLKREGRLAEAKEELKQAKLLEKETTSSEDKSPNLDTEERTPGRSTSKANSSDAAHVTKKEETDGSPPKMSSRDRFKMQQESLSHKRQALKLRREGRMEEAEAEFELAKNLESQLEALTAAAEESTKPAGLVDDVGVEDLLDPQLLSALREVGIEGGVALSSPEKAEPVKAKPVVNTLQAEPVRAKPVVNKNETTKNDRMELEEEIKAEKVKAVSLKRSGKQAEALDALRRAKLLEKKLNSLA